MILPSDKQCWLIVHEMFEFEKELNDFERSFARSNETRREFTDAQKVTIKKFMRKYEFKCLKQSQ